MWLGLWRVGVRIKVGVGIRVRFGRKIGHPVSRMNWWHFLPRLVPRVAKVHFSRVVFRCWG